ncbi:hypothetical protein CV093_02680 [Oceanobacillus sp. 143]|nr:hypothetical protein CV093_02680 [Oceanobacillus sp. 143]
MHKELFIMFKKKRITLFSLFMLLSILFACSTENTNENEEDSAEAPADANENQEDTATIPNGELQKKDQGDQVELLQESLNELGYDISVNGTFDEATTWAVTDFQLQHKNLMALGIYNEETQQVLTDSLAKGEK